MRRRRGTEIEVVVSWGTEAPHVLRVAYVADGESLALPEGAVEGALPLRVTFRGAPRVVPPLGSRVTIEGRAAPVTTTVLTESAPIEIRLGAVTVRARLVGHEAHAEAPRSFRGLAPLAASSVAHVACLVALAHASSATFPAGEITPDQLGVMRRLLAASEVIPEGAPPSVRRAAIGELAHHGHATEQTSRAPPLAPPSGVPSAAKPTLVAGIGPLSPNAPRGSRAADLEDAAGFGMIALARGLKADGPEAPSWTDALASAGAHAEAVQSLFGDPPMDQRGTGGLHLSSTGSGGGGKAGDGKEVSLEIPVLTEMLERERATFVPGAIVKVPDTHARLGPPAPLDQVPSRPLPRDTIARLVQANGWRFRDCHAVLQRRAPSAGGGVDVAFTITPTGKVSEAHETGGDLADDAARACVARAFYALTFAPEPRRRDQEVTYHVLLAPRPAPSP